MKILLLSLLALPVFANSCILSSGTYSSLASTAGHWTGCGGGVAGNGDTADISAASLTIAASETWTIGTSGATGTDAVLLGAAGVIIPCGIVLSRGNIRSGQGTTAAIQVCAGGQMALDHLLAPIGTYYEYIADGWSRGIQLNGTSTDCHFNGVVYAGSTCAVFTSIGPIGGDINMGAGPATYVEAFTGSYAAISNLGSATRNAITLSQPSTPNNNFTLDHVSFQNCGLIYAQANVTVNLHNFAFSGGLNTYDFDFNDTSTSTFTRTLTDGVFSGGLAIVAGGSNQPWDMERLYFKKYPLLGVPPSSTCAESFYVSADNDAIIPCGSVDYPVFFRNVTGVTAHFIQVPGTPAGTTQAITNFYGEFPDPDAGGNQGKMLLTAGANPASPTQTNVSNMLLVPNKFDHGSAEIVPMGIGTPNNLLTVAHATAWVQGGAGVTVQQAALLDEGGTSSGTFNFLANIFYSDQTFFKSISFNPSAPSNNTIKTADYNAAGNAVYASNPSCPLCTGQTTGTGWTHKCTAGSGVNCPAGAHDISGAPGFVNTTYRVVTWDTLGLPAHAVCSAWIFGAAYVYIPGLPICVSVSNPTVYSGLSINYVLTASHTSGASTKPDSGANWRDDWEEASLYDFRYELVNGQTFAGDSPAKAFWKWVGTGWTPTNSAYLTTFPGDTNPVANLGAFVMASVSPPAPTVTISASPTSILFGQYSTLTWSSTNAIAVSITGLGSVATAGTAMVTPSSTTTYTITATGLGGSATPTSATVTVSPAPPPPTCSGTFTVSGGTVTIPAAQLALISPGC